MWVKKGYQKLSFSLKIVITKALSLKRLTTRGTNSKLLVKASTVRLVYYIFF